MIEQMKKPAKKPNHRRQTLFNALATLTSSKEIKKFFNDLCTPAELEAMADRWFVVDYLQKEMPYREIHDKTGVSITTIGRVARSLEYGSGGYSLAYQRTNRENQND